MTANAAEYRATVLFGELKFREPEFVFVDHGDGTGELQGEYVTMEGDNEQMREAAAIGCFRLTNPEAFLSASKRKAWWRRWLT